MLYDDFFVMIDSILDYVKKHPGCEVLNADDPMARRIGFTTRALEETWLSKLWHQPWVKWGFLGRWLPSLKPKRTQSEVWEISLVKLRGSTTNDNVPVEKRLLVKDCLMSLTGRHNLASDLTRGRNPFVPNTPQ